MSDPTDDELRVQVAELMGWTVERGVYSVGDQGEKIFDCGTPPGGNTADLKRDLPDYPNDLNACRDFEQSRLLSVDANGRVQRDRRHEYSDYLWIVCCPRENPDVNRGWGSPTYATARQRCLAFVRTMGGAR